MKIDRHNYESWFLLYIDGELSEADCREVEAFALVHPDLGEELEMLQLTRLQPDDQVEFAFKNSLFRSESENEINDHNYQEWLLSSTDGELTPEQEGQLKNWLASRPAVTSELAAYQRARLEPDYTIAFPDKSLLYRHEEPRRIIGIRWQRIAVAASLLLTISTSIWLLSRQQSVAPENNSIAQTDASRLPAIKSPSIDEPKEPGSSNENSKIALNEDVRVNSGDENVNTLQSGKSNLTSNNQVDAVVKQSANAEKQGNDLPDGSKTNPNLQTLLQQSKEENSNGMGEYAVNSPSELKAPAVDYLTNPKQINTGSTVTPGVSQPLEIMYVSNAGTADSDADMNESGKKNSLRGFLRKVTRTFEKTTNLRATDEDDRLLIGGLAIQL